MSEKTAEINVKGWVGTTYRHWFKQFGENPYRAAGQVLFHLDCLGRRDLSSMKDAANELKSVAGNKVFKDIVED